MGVGRGSHSTQRTFVCIFSLLSILLINSQDIYKKCQVSFTCLYTFIWHSFAKKACGTPSQGRSYVVFYWYSLGLPDRQSQ